MSADAFGNHSELFSPLPEGKPRWRSFGVGFGLEIFLLFLALWLPTLFPKQMDFATRYMVSAITAPPLEAWKPRPAARPRPAPVKRAEAPKPVPVPDPPKPRLIEPVFSSPIVKRPIQKKDVQTPEVKSVAPELQANALANSESADLKRPRAPVQTGGFGDPEGLPATTKVTHTVNINQQGSFDLPSGPGKGNGTGGAKGAVGSAGFGSETAAGNRRSGTVQEGLFATAETMAGQPHVRKTANETPAEEPVVILFKPQPQYTAEAKQMKIQGEVLLQVVFKASGQVDVQRVIKGLGHGLDENAEAAARLIKFKPARQDGQPVDFPATVRIQFELAY
jgi:TonB family protein